MQTAPGYLPSMWPFPSPTVPSGSPTVTVKESIQWRGFFTSSQTDWITQVLHDIQEAYTIPRPGEVFGFLRYPPSLPELICEAAKVLYRSFGRDARLVLDLAHDPETGSEELFALVHVDVPIEEALQKLRQFDEEWFLDKQEAANGLFNVDVVFA